MRIVGKSTNCSTAATTCLLLNIGIVTKCSHCRLVIKNLQAIRSSRFRLVAVATIQECVSCRKYASEVGIEAFKGYQGLLAMPSLDLIMELTGDEAVLADLLARKRPSVNVLDRHASMVLLEMVERESEMAGSSLASTLLEASPDGILVIDRECRVLNCNKSPMIPDSTDSEAVFGRYCFELMQKSTSACRGHARNCPAHEVLKTGKLARRVYETTGPDNSTQLRQSTVYPVFNRLGEITQFVLAIRDMTGDVSKKVEECAQAIKEDLARVVQEDRLTSLGRLVASVCHEINNPITSIVTFIKLIRSIIRKGNLSPEEASKVERYLDLSFNEGMRCGYIVKDLLTFARPKTVEARMTDLADVIGTVLLLTGHQLELSRIRTVLDLPPPPFAAWADCAQLQQCILNIVFNAIDAMPEGGTLSISGGFGESGLVWLKISDSGHGIAQADLPRVFEPFFSTKADGKGVGLGLSVVYGIIREHNGEVEVESTPGKGTTFKILLPGNPVDGPAVEPVPSRAFIESPSNRS